MYQFIKGKLLRTFNDRWECKENMSSCTVGGCKNIITVYLEYIFPFMKIKHASLFIKNATQYTGLNHMPDLNLVMNVIAKVF